MRKNFEMWLEVLGFIIGYNVYKIRQALSDITDSLLAREASDPSVVIPNPKQDYTPKRVGLVEPKSPQLMEFEEDEELRRQNPGRF